MKIDSVAKHYRHLTPEERVRLILEASERGDEAERDRLVGSAHRIEMGMPEHSPRMDAVHQISTLVFVELLDSASFYLEMLARIDAVSSWKADEGGNSRLTRRLLDATLSAGYVLRTRHAGWLLFCERRGLPPAVHWRLLPGYDRLQRALLAADAVAFDDAEFLEYVSAARRETGLGGAGKELTPEVAADAADELFEACLSIRGAR